MRDCGRAKGRGMKTSIGGIRDFALAATRILLIAGALAAGGAAAQGTAKATFAGGCFWCMEPPSTSFPA
jgi:hypothetical protein